MIDKAASKVRVEPTSRKRSGLFVLHMAMLLTTGAWSSSALTGSAAAATYSNPVTADGMPIRMGDPFAFRADDNYFLIGTNAPSEGFRLYRSTDLVHWKEARWALKKTPDFWAQDAFWAPEVAAYRGKYYMVYSAMVRGSGPPKLLLGLAISDRPQGPFRSLYGPWFDAGYSAIDGDIFVDRDGTPYLYFSRNGTEHGYGYGKIYGVKLAADLSKLIGEPTELLQASQSWERVNWAKNRCNEGPTVFWRHGLYYMTYSANSTFEPTYGVGYATASRALGPWKKSAKNPVLATDVTLGVSGPGHNSIVLSPDRTEQFIVYHTHADPKHPSEERVVNIDRLILDVGGRLRVIGPTRSPQPMPSNYAASEKN